MGIEDKWEKIQILNVAASGASACRFACDTSVQEAKATLSHGDLLHA